MRTSVRALAVAMALAATAKLSGAANVTIDDTNGDPTTGARIAYSPVGFWQFGPACANCTKADPALAFDQTWSEVA